MSDQSDLKNTNNNLESEGEDKSLKIEEVEMPKDVDFGDEDEYTEEDFKKFVGKFSGEEGDEVISFETIDDDDDE